MKIIPIMMAILLSACAIEPPVAQAKNCRGVNIKLCQFATKNRLRVISGFRRNAKIAGTHKPSLHASGRAIDVYPPKGVSRKTIEKRAHRAGFRVGWYCGRMHHLHIEIKGSARTWYKGCGKKKG